MAHKDNTQIDLESTMLFSELDHFIAKSQEKSDDGFKEIVAAKSFKVEIEASVIARKILDQERFQSNKKQLSSSQRRSAEFLSDPEAMAADHYMSCLLGCFEQLMNTVLGVNNYSVLIVDDDRNARDTIQRYTMPVGTGKYRAMEFQEAKNGKEAVYLHLAGASFDLIIMDDQMPIMTGIQLLRKMGVKSRIGGVTSESGHQAFIDAGLNTCIRKPRSLA
uniref:Response regulatory domain-containing protein n=1 Tax=Populus alba TaxID=43335 RepID=A0A4U5QE42_POPAL|nr:hypothetical protein D5086_0000099720 [Populus alba]